MKNSLLAALSLDGGWISDRLMAKELAVFLRLAGPGPVWTDCKTKPVPGLRRAPRRELEKRVGKEPLRILGTPELNAALLYSETPLRLFIWWRAQIGHGPRRTLVPAGTPFHSFRLRSLRRLGGEAVGVYEGAF